MNLLVHLDYSTYNPQFVSGSWITIMSHLTQLLKSSDLTIVYFTIPAYCNVTYAFFCHDYFDEFKKYYSYLLNYLENHSCVFIKTRTFDLIIYLCYNCGEKTVSHFVPQIILIISNFIANYENDPHIIHTFTKTVTTICEYAVYINLPALNILKFIFATFEKVKLNSKCTKLMAYLICAGLSLIVSYKMNSKNNDQNFDFLPIILSQLSYFVNQNEIKNVPDQLVLSNNINQAEITNHDDEIIIKNEKDQAEITNQVEEIVEKSDLNQSEINNNINQDVIKNDLNQAIEYKCDCNSEITEIAASETHRDFSTLFIKILSHYEVNTDDFQNKNNFFQVYFQCLFNKLSNFEEMFIPQHSLNIYEFDIFEFKLKNINNSYDLYYSLIFLIKNMKNEYFENSKFINQSLKQLYNRYIENNHNKYEEEFYVLRCFTCIIELFVENNKIDEAIEIWNNSINVKNCFLESIQRYSNTIPYMCLYVSFYKCLKVLGKDSLSVSELHFLADIINEKLTQILEYLIKCDDPNFLIKCDNSEDSQEEIITIRICSNDRLADCIKNFINDISIVFEEKIYTMIENIYNNVLKNRHTSNYNTWTKLSLSLLKNILKYSSNLSLLTKYYFVFSELNFHLSSDDYRQYLLAFQHCCLVAEFKLYDLYSFVTFSIPFLKSNIKSLNNINCTWSKIEYYDDFVTIYAKYLYYVPNLFDKIEEEIINYVNMLPVKSRNYDFNLSFICSSLDSKVDLFVQNQSVISHLIYSLLFMSQKCTNKVIVKMSESKLDNLKVCFNISFILFS